MSEIIKPTIKLKHLSALLSVVPGHVEIHDIEAPYQLFRDARVKTAAELKGTIDLWSTYSRSAESISGSVHLVRLFDAKGNWVKMALLRNSLRHLHSAAIEIDVGFNNRADLRAFYGVPLADGLFPDTGAVVMAGVPVGVRTQQRELKLVVRDGDNTEVSERDINYDERLVAVAKKLLTDVIPPEAERMEFVGNVWRAQMKLDAT